MSVISANVNNEACSDAITRVLIEIRLNIADLNSILNIIITVIIKYAPARNRSERRYLRIPLLCGNGVTKKTTAMQAQQKIKIV